MFRRLIVFLILALIIGSSACQSQSVDITNQPGASLIVDKSFTEDAPIYNSLSKLVSDADYIFKGKLSMVEPVAGATWTWEIYDVDELYKGIDSPSQIRMVSGIADTGMAKHEVGSDYFVFATVYELPVYPYPLINPIYNQTIFKILDDGTLSLGGITDRSMLPAVYEEQFIQDPAKAISEFPALLKAQDWSRVADRYQSPAEALNNSDLVIHVVFDSISEINQYVSIAQVGEIRSSYKADPDNILPTSIAVSEDLEPGVEYIVFMQYDELGESLMLASRAGSIIGRADNESQWVAALEALGNAG